MTSTAEFDCHWQCVECGFQIAAPTQLGRPGYREHAEVGPSEWRPQDPCRGCGQVAWASLRDGAVIEVLEARDEQRQAKFRRRGGVMGMIAAGFGWMCVTALLLAGGQPEGLASLSVVSATLTTAGILSSLPDDGLPERANGWSHAPTPRGSEQLRAQGSLAAAEELRAPLSDRRCLAYELGVRHDSDPRGELGSWTLLEQRSAAGLSVDAVELDEVPYLRVERQIYAQELDARARRVLRERGLDPERPGYTLFETIIEPDAHAQLFAHSGGLVVSLA